MGSKADIKTNLLYQLEENKEHLYVQDNQINRMNQKIKDIIGVNLNINELKNPEKNDNENLSKF